MKFALSLAAASLAFSVSAAAHHDEKEAAEVVVRSDMEFPADAVWMHSFDAYESEAGKPNAAFLRALGFIRAMEAEGVDPEQANQGAVGALASVFNRYS